MGLGMTIGGFAGAAGGGMIGGATVRLILDSSQFNSGLAASQTKLQTWGRSLSTLGSRMTRGLTVPIAAIAGLSVKMALDFETAFNRIDAVTNTSAANLAAWKEGVLGLAGETARSPQELAEALYFLASAGLDANQVMPTLEMSAKAAASGLGETADVARLTANVLNAYSKSGITAAEVTDTLVAAVREGTAEPDEFAEAMGKILPIASKAGVGFDQLAGSLAGLSNIGLDVNEGVTAMRGLISALVAPGAQASDALKKMGLSAQEMLDALSQDGLLAAMELLETRAAAVTDSEAGMIGLMRQAVPNIRALTGLFGLTEQEATKVAAAFDRVSHSTGDMGKAFETTKKGPQFEFQQAWAQLQSTFIRVGQEILPVVTKIVDKVGDIAKAFSDLGPDAQNAILIMLGIAALAGPLLKIIGLVLTLGSAWSKVKIPKGPLPGVPVPIGGGRGVPTPVPGGKGGLPIGPIPIMLAYALGSISGSKLPEENFVAAVHAANDLADAFTKGEITATQYNVGLARLKGTLDDETDRTNLASSAAIGLRDAHEEAGERLAAMDTTLNALGGSLTKHQTQVRQAALQEGNYGKAIKVTSEAIGAAGKKMTEAGAAAIKASGGVQRFGNDLQAIPATKDVQITSSGADEAIDKALRLRGAYASIPKQVVTNVVTHYTRTGTPSGAGGHAAAQHGMHSYVHQPTWILAGERGTERVDISPHVGSPKHAASMAGSGGGGGGNVTVRFGNVAIYNDTDLEDLAGMVAGVVEQTVWRGANR